MEKKNLHHKLPNVKFRIEYIFPHWPLWPQVHTPLWCEPGVKKIPKNRYLFDVYPNVDCMYKF